MRDIALHSHMPTKTLVFVGGARIERAFTGRHRARFERARSRLAGRHRLQRSTLLLSSVTGLPPFYLTTVVCGALKMSLRDFLLLGTAGRAIRFAVLILLPQMLRPAVGQAQTIAPAITVSGEGARPSRPHREELVALEPLGKLVTVHMIEGAGQFPHEEGPDAVVDRLVRVRQAPASAQRGALP